MTDQTAIEVDEIHQPPRSQWLDVWDQFKKHRGAVIGAIVFLLILFGVFVVIRESKHG